MRMHVRLPDMVITQGQYVVLCATIISRNLRLGERGDINGDYVANADRSDLDCLSNKILGSEKPRMALVTCDQLRNNLQARSGSREGPKCS